MTDLPSEPSQEQGSSAGRGSEDFVESYFKGQEELIRSLLEESHPEEELIRKDQDLLLQRQELLERVKAEDEAVLDGMLLSITKVGEALRRIDGNPSLTNEEANREVSVWAHVMTSVAPFVDALVNSQDMVLHEEWQKSLLETERRLLALHSNVNQTGKEKTELQERLSNIRLQALSSRTDFMLNLPLAPSEDVDGIRGVWDRQRSCDHLISDFQVLEASGFFDTHDQVKKLNGHIVGLNEVLIASLSKLPEETSRSLVKEWLEEICDDSEELMTEVEELPLDLALDMLSELKESMSFSKKLKPSLHDPDLKKRLKKIEKQGHNEWVEKGISYRLEKRFGKTSVTLFENLILGLIVIVCGLLFVEGAFDLTIPQQYLMIGVDTFICAIFLLEFFLKFGHSPDKLNYFKRHAFVDLLPSIPFGFLLLCIGLTPEVLAGGESGVAQHTGDIIALRLLRFARLPRLIRYIKIARPLIRLLRVMIFAFRALDRLVRRQAGVINRNIVLFEPKAYVKEGKKVNSLSTCFRESILLLQEVSFRVAEACEKEHLKYFLKPRVELAGIRSRSLEGMNQDKVLSYDYVKAHQDIRLEDAIESLSTMDIWSLRSRYDEKSLLRLSGLIHLMHRRPLRWLPIFQDLGRGGNEDDPAMAVVSSCRAIGRTLEKWQSKLHWCIDFYGIITPPQLLDKVGQILVKGASRPAKRLVIFGTAFLLLMGLVELTGIELFEQVATKLAKTLGIPIIFLGVLCWTLLLFGKWLKKIASSSSEYYERTGEAQFLGLLTEAKQVHHDDDAEFYYQRCVEPEIGVREGSVSLEISTAQKDMQELVLTAFGNQESRSGDESRQVYLLYRDYQLTPPFHRHSKKTTNQFLGNLTLEGIRKDRLSFSPREFKAQEALDLESSRSLLGPHLWFSLITHSISQRSARLIINYNSHCIPTKAVENFSEPMQHRFESWLADHGDSRGADSRSQEKESSVGFSTQAFSALDFLFADPKREAAIEDEFGPEVMGFLQDDRKNLLRKIFGNYPFHKWPTSRRSINPYQLYWNYVGNGRIFILPFRLVWIGLMLVGWSIGRFAGMIRSVLVSNETFEPQAESPDPYSVAMRKLNRMRKPVAMATMLLRARFDPEYLGLSIEGCPDGTARKNQLREDLDFVGASPDEREEFDELRQSMREGLETFSRLLRSEMWGQISKGKASDPEVLRALAVAVCINYHSIRDIFNAPETLSEWASKVADSASSPAGGLGRGVMTSLKSKLPMLKSLARECYDRFCERHVEMLENSCPAGIDVKKFKEELYLSLCNKENSKIVNTVKVLGGEESRRLADELLTVAGTARVWSRELVILRAVQSLAQLDMLSEKRLLESVAALEKQD